MFKKSKRNFRQRQVHYDSDSDDELKKKDVAVVRNYAAEFANSTKPINSTLIIPEDISSTHIAPKLCLLGQEEGEEDGEVFRVKKSVHSRRLARQKNRDKKHHPIGNASPELNLDIEEPMHVTYDSSPVCEIEEPSQSPPIDGVEMESSSEEETETGHQSVQAVLQGGAIPDAHMIFQLKKRRQMARNLDADNEDFIPVDNGKKTVYEKIQGKGRLIREDDNDKSDDEDGIVIGSRMSFGVDVINDRKRKEQAFYAAITEENNMHASEASTKETDDELWVQEQIRKAVNLPQLHCAQEASRAEMQFYESLSGCYESEGYGDNGVVPTTDLQFQQERFTSKKTNVVIDDFTQMIQDRISNFDEVYRTHNRESEQVAEELESLQSDIVTSGTDITELGVAFAFYQQIRGYVIDLTDCLNEKVVKITELEEDFMVLLESRANCLVKRRQQDVRDQADEHSGRLAKMAAIVTTDPHNPTNKGLVEEYQSCSRRAAEREGRRVRRKKGKQLSSEINVEKDDFEMDGMSTDDEFAKSENCAFSDENAKIFEAAKDIFDDVSEEFHCVSLILKQFASWKRKYPFTYEETYVSLCLWKILGPFIRLQMIEWNPLLYDCRDINAYLWYQNAVSYGACDDAEQEITEDISLVSLLKDSDSNLIPALVEKILLPRLTEFARRVWDPMCRTQTMSLVRIFKGFFSVYPISGKSKITYNLLKEIIMRTKKALDDDIFIPLYGQQILDNKQSEACLFFYRQFAMTIKLLKNVMVWNGIISNDLLREMAIDGLLNRYILLALQSIITSSNAVGEALVIVNRVLSCFPSRWIQEQNESLGANQIEPLCRLLVRCAELLSKNADEKTAKTRILDIAIMLKRVGAKDHVKSLVSKYSIRDWKS